METKKIPSIDVKCRFFAQHWGQKICEYNFNKEKLDFVKVETLLCSFEKIDNWSLFLKPIINDTEYKIPDGWEFYKEYTPKKDGYAGMKIRKQYESDDIAFNEYGYKYDMILPTKINIGIDQYRAEGYAVPFMEYSVEDLVSFGWVRLV